MVEGKIDNKRHFCRVNFGGTAWKTNLTMLSTHHLAATKIRRPRESVEILSLSRSSI